jgi:hypothetical protein
MLKRIAALIFIFVCTSFAWIVLGTTIFHRTYASNAHLRGRVASIWGGPHEQHPPSATTASGAVLPLERTRIAAAIDLERRQKGLLWYNTYKVAFQGAYTFRNKGETPQQVSFMFPLAAEKAVYDGLRLELDGKPLDVQSAASRHPRRQQYPQAVR